eukprot:112810-Prorocentrum_minimum.AAC.1
MEAATSGPTASSEEHSSVEHEEHSTDRFELRLSSRSVFVPTGSPDQLLRRTAMLSARGDQVGRGGPGAGLESTHVKH